MDKKEKHFVEQDAPLKNTDKAFVKVSHDGSPSMPKTSEEEKADKPLRDDVKDRTGDKR